MSLTLGPGPLSNHAPAGANYAIEGPAHKLLFQEHPRRVRAELAGQVVLDTARGRLLHETGLIPRLYVPFEDLDAAALERTDTRTHCPFKGDASYWSLRVGDRVSKDAVWAYEHPLERASWLAGWASVYFERADAWYEEDTRVFAHFRDPYHRVDARPSSRRVEVRAGDTLVAASERPTLVFETGLPIRAYLPREDVTAELEPSATHTRCPYKGEARYYEVRANGELVNDGAWTYVEGLPDGPRLEDLVAFDDGLLEVRIG
jgi:uncharacterized protein (DUF427 family)